MRETIHSIVQSFLSLPFPPFPPRVSLFIFVALLRQMPTECIANPLQRELADAIIRLQPLDEIRILLACGAKPNEPVTQGLRPLHYAVWQRYTEAAQLLLVRGADIDATDECGYSALHLAAEHGYLDLVKLLLKYGAKVDHRQDTGELFPRCVLHLNFEHYSEQL